MRIFLLGDVHANAEWLGASLMAAKRRQCDVVLQVGDFGWWPHTPSGRTFVETANRMLEDAQIDCWWIDGNHENFEDLWDGNACPDHLVWPTPRLCYVPRGVRWEWEGVSFVGLGGGYSIDRQFRKPGASWWPQELVTARDVAKSLSHGSCDVLVTHDAPLGTLTFDGADAPRLGNYKQDRISRSNRHLVRIAMDGLGPQILVHGHWHMRNHEVLEGVEVLGLDRDGDRDSWAVLELHNGRPYLEDESAPLTVGSL